MANAPNSYVDIEPQLFAKFFEKLCDKILEEELGGKLPDRVSMYHVSLFLIDKKDTTLSIHEYLQTANDNNSPITSPKYLHEYYKQISKNKLNVVNIEGTYLYNCLIYMGIKPTKNVLKIVSLPRRAKLLLEKFEAQEKAKETKPTSEETGPAPIKLEGKNKQPDFEKRQISDPTFYYKQKYQDLLELRKIEKFKAPIFQGVFFLGIIYCCYFLWHIFRQSEHIGNWRWFSIAAFFILISIYLNIASSKKDRRYLLEIRKLEYYFATSVYIKGDSYFASHEYQQWLLRAIPHNHKVEMPLKITHKLVKDASPDINTDNDPRI